MSQKLVKFIDGEMVEYEIRKLVDFYDPILRQPTQKLELEMMDAKEILYYVYSMAMMLDHYQGALGLSANQVGWPIRMCAINLGHENVVLINPEIIRASPLVTTYHEGCVSYPGLYLKVPRSTSIIVESQSPTGKIVQQEYDGLTAICIQHEIDHLDGIVYTEKVSPITLDKAKRKIKTNLKKMKKFALSKASELELRETLLKEQQKNIQKSVEPRIELPQIIVPEELKMETPTNFVYKTE